ncbi:hypothetical protein IQ247_21970 [Plectonema cf. radiosum LEGE 06105]|uniref:Uncharacterized protein n=1 Tax=Plectonema cf. radiosum LEGE 06105 TaxID=945769 RepID=A0A8J7F522_9CYAN|nr:hypothetical protein [Plectonema radiosum]MBE9215295.1 hypothetical protein [Plectonema cf. radiosum LEGE 06105]
MRYIPSKFLSFPLLLTCAIFLIAITSHSSSLLFSLLIGSLLMIAIQIYGEFRQSSQYVISVIQTVVIVILLSIFWLDYFSTPAAAQFFGKAENFFKNTLTQGSQGGANDAVSLVFNVLRALYLLYIAMALIGVINAVRKDEDWQVVARTPLLVVIAVTIADVLTSFVIG